MVRGFEVMDCCTFIGGNYVSMVFVGFVFCGCITFVAMGRLPYVDSIYCIVAVGASTAVFDKMIHVELVCGGFVANFFKDS